MMESAECEESPEFAFNHDVFLSDSAVEVSTKEIIQKRNPPVEAVKRFDFLPSYTHIFENYLMKNVPFILGKSATSEWKSRKDWVTEEGKPNLKFLAENFGHVTVPIADCKREQYSSQPKCEMTLGEYTQYWESYIGAGYPPSMESLYLKDWHFTRDFPGYPAYTTPNYFNSDWLNEFWDRRSDEVDDYRFVYMGPKGSWTPFHADVFRSFSWSANICGRKKWILFPPGEEDNLRDSLGNLVYDVFSANLKDVTKYPQYQQVHKPFEVYQEEGEIIYVPSGWHHQVHNMEDTISINHNWINGCNIDLCWTFLMENLADVQREIADCATMDGWNEQCQIILKASSGINFEEFFRFISTVATNRLASLKQLCTWKGKTHGDVNGKLLSIEKSKRFRKDNVQNVKDNIRTGTCANFVSCVSDSTYYDGSDGQRNDTKAIAARHCTDACCSRSASGDRVFKEVSSRNHSIQATEGGTCGATISSHTSLQNTSCDFTHGVLLDSEQTKNDVDLDSSKSSPFSSTSFRMDSFHGSCHEQSMINQNNCQIIFDLQRLEYVLSAMLQKAEFSSIDFREYSPCPAELLLSLSQVFKK